MNKAILSIAMLVIGGLLNIGCMNQAAVSVKDGHYEGNARSTDPEALLDTVSRNRTRETYAEAYRGAVMSGAAYPYGMVGPVGDYRNYYCPNGACISPPQPPAPPQQRAPKATPKPSPATSADPAQQPVTREELEKVKAQAADAQNKANVSIGILKTVRTEKGKPQESAPTAPPPPPPAATPAPKPLTQQDIDEVNKRAEDARKRADTVTTASGKP